jgi:pimeloyl-ACP methyl ester carboxylesterase
VNRWNGTENDETYIVRDVVGFVDRHYRTLRDPRFPAIMGLSEGGYGATNLTVRNPDVIGAAVALTGYFRADPHEVLFWDNPFDHDEQMMRANSPILREATLPPTVRHRLHVVIYDGAYTSRARRRPPVGPLRRPRLLGQPRHRAHGRSLPHLDLQARQCAMPCSA